jgi:hypothetical protein
LISADEALHALLDGNARFERGQPRGPRRSPEEFRVLAEAQFPEAVIVTCADSFTTTQISSPGTAQIAVHTPANTSGDLGCDSGGNSKALTFTVT